MHGTDDPFLDFATFCFWKTYAIVETCICCPGCQFRKVRFMLFPVTCLDLVERWIFVCAVAWGPEVLGFEDGDQQNKDASNKHKASSPCHVNHSAQRQNVLYLRSLAPYPVWDFLLRILLAMIIHTISSECFFVHLDYQLSDSLFYRVIAKFSPQVILMCYSAVPVWTQHDPRRQTRGFIYYVSLAQIGLDMSSESDPYTKLTRLAHITATRAHSCHIR